MQEKYCNTCKETKPITEFVKTKQTKSGVVSNCKTCRNAYAKRRRETNYEFVRATEKESHRKYRLLYMYGITREEYDQKLANQNNCCAICGTHVSNTKRALAVDHDHVTGKVRDLLCGKCNTGLGQFKDSLELLEKAVTYLKEHK